MRARFAPLLLAPLLLAACASTPRPGPPPVLPPPPPPPAGTEALMGRTPEAVLLMLGPATLDRREGPSRHLQWSRPACVLDLWFYPRGGALLSSHAAARVAGGDPIAAGTCFTRLRAPTVRAPTPQPPPPPQTRRKARAGARR